MPAEPPAAPAQPGIRLAGVGVAVADMTDQGPVTRTILSDIDAHLAAPMTSVVGSNGSGKSTFCQLLNGLVPADAGTVTVDGLDPARSPRAVRERVGFVFTDPAAQLVMPTVGEDVELSLRRAEPRAAARRERALAVLDELGIADLAARSVYELSGGQRQLAALAAVLAVDPAILVLDEPTTLLDLRNREVLRALLFRLVAQRGLRIVVSTHDLALAAEADDALHFEAGRLVAHGAPAEVVAGYRAAVLGAL
ncbi:energy-coupling factor ABC transporter ATP-binding protein [Brevibacterium rongguiense]|uniref:energy-coupling factor ABC transporter ATP-binding protein n=1 Tax=Brevibacterium rongguiense TaxID=2695267 RepID=UPI002E282021|nr:ABC transporter ATP-binding protein [Brevibacterium rongguiense]